MGGGWERPRELLQPIRPARLRLLSCLAEEKWVIQKWRAGNWSPGLARKAGIIVGFGKVGVKERIKACSSGQKF